NFFYGVWFNRWKRVAPFAANVRQYGRDLIIIKDLQARHVQLVRFALYGNWPAQTVQRDAHQALLRASDPLRINQRRRQSFLAKPGRLMATAATHQVKRFALL